MGGVKSTVNPSETVLVFSPAKLTALTMTMYLAPLSRSNPARMMRDKGNNTIITTETLHSNTPYKAYMTHDARNVEQIFGTVVVL